MAVLAKITLLFINWLRHSTEIAVRFFGHKSVKEPTAVTADVKIPTDQGHQSGTFEDLEQKIVERVLRLRDRTAHSLMTHRSEMIWLDITDPVNEKIKKIIASRHSSFVVCEGDLERVLGLTRVKDVLAQSTTGSTTIAIPISTQMPPLVPEGINALEVLERLREAKSPLALVVNEYGSIAGMVTLTDLLEAIVGYLPGMDAKDLPAATQREDGSWLLDGRLSVAELQRLLDLDELPEADANYTTVSGLFMAQLGQIPVVGDKFKWKQLCFEVISMNGQRVDKTLITPTPPGQH